MNFKELPECANEKQIYEKLLEKRFLEILSIDDLYEQYTLAQDFVNRHLLQSLIGDKLTLDVSIIPIPLDAIPHQNDIPSEKLVKVAYTCTGPTPPLTLDEDGMAHIDFGDDIKLSLELPTDDLPLFMFDYKREGDILKEDSISLRWCLSYTDKSMEVDCNLHLICMTPASLHLNQLGSKYNEYGKFEDVLVFLEHQSNLMDNQYRIVPIHNTSNDEGGDTE